MRARPTAADVHRVHDRYLIDVVEGFGLCPFSRHSREAGRVHRPLIFIDREPQASEAAAALAKVAREHRDAEIVLLTFVDLIGAFDRASAFDAFVPKVREAFDACGERRFFMVAFHPELGRAAPRPLTKDSLVPLIRRSPDPVIQCVDAKTLEDARAHAQQSAKRRLLTKLDDEDPLMSALIKNSIQADSELSADIAKTNFETVGRGDGREDFEQRLLELRADRDRTYGWSIPSE